MPLDVFAVYSSQQICRDLRGSLWRKKKGGRTGRSVVVTQGSAATLAALQVTGIGVMTTVAVVRRR
jgi:hypothetical protein